MSNQSPSSNKSCPIFIIVLQPQADQQQVSSRALEDTDKSQRLKKTLPVEGRAPQRYIPSRRLVHLDFKGAPPRLPYLKGVLALAANLGATGVLLEWEDMFPWSGR